MGVFDYVTCLLPEVPQGLDWQTKDTPAQWCDRYEIRADGTLWHQNYDVEDRSDPRAEGLMRMVGCMTSVNHRWEKCDLTGEVRFYAHTDPKDISGTWVEYSAYFVGGQLKHLEKITGRGAA